jgi:hypothetical protein
MQPLRTIKIYSEPLSGHLSGALAGRGCAVSQFLAEWRDPQMDALGAKGYSRKPSGVSEFMTLGQVVRDLRERKTGF